MLSVSALKLSHLSLQVSPLVLHDYPSLMKLFPVGLVATILLWRPCVWLSKRQILVRLEHKTCNLTSGIINTAAETSYQTTCQLSSQNKHENLSWKMCIWFCCCFLNYVFICSWNYQQQIEIHVCFVDMFSPFEEGVKLARNFLIFWNGNLYWAH